VLAIIATVIGVMVPTFLSLRTAEQARATTQNLEAATRAIAAFVQANGCLPCPMPAHYTLAPGRGMVRGDAAVNAQACGVCQTSTPVVAITNGILPYRSLGLPERFARDGYGRWMTYAVDRGLTMTIQVVIPPARICQTGDEVRTPPICSSDDIAKKKHPAATLCGAAFPTASSISIYFDTASSSSMAFVLVSHGANGLGTYRAMPEIATDRILQPASACTTNMEERCNTDNNILFSAASPGSQFDDQLIYLSRDALVSYLGGAACNKVVPP
jgi:hypothetical protein